MNTPHYYLSFCLFLAYLLCACTSRHPTPTPSASATPLATLTTPSPWVSISTPISNPIKTPTFIPTGISTVSPTDTPVHNLKNTPTIPTEEWLKSQCLDINPSLPRNIKLSGVLVLAPSPVDYMAPAYLYDLATGEKTSLLQLEHEIVANFSVSPNRQWLAYENSTLDESNHINKSRLVIADSTGKEHTTISLQENEWFWRGYWLNNEWLIIKQREQLTMDAMRLVNPFTHEQHTIQPWGTYPDIYPLTDNVSLWSVAAILDPTQKLVVYPGTTEEGRSILILWDQTEARELARFADFRFFPLEIPKWSPDGEKLVFVSTVKEHVPPQNIYDEIFSVSRAGQITQLTHLTAAYQEVSIGSYSWSPDGNRLAFWARFDAAHETNLEILDNNSKKITNYCVAGDLSVWSPEGQQMVFKNINIASKQGRIVLLDIQQGFAAVITDVSLNPVGWMK